MRLSVGCAASVVDVRGVVQRLPVVTAWGPLIGDLKVPGSVRTSGVDEFALRRRRWVVIVNTIAKVTLLFRVGSLSVLLRRGKVLKVPLAGLLPVGLA